jgi:hypothetical protein
MIKIEKKDDDIDKIKMGIASYKKY